MRVLGLDTTTSRGSVALLDGNELLGEVRLAAPDSHSGRVLPAVDFLLRGLGLEPVDLDAFAVAIGPGSFTGLRVGIGTVQGLALGSGRPCLGIPALDALAARIRGGAPCLVAMMDAYRGEVFAARYDGEARRQGPMLAEAPQVFLERVPELAAFIGDGAERYRAEILHRLPKASFPARSLYLAGTLARLAAPRLAAGEGIPPASLQPLYLREADLRKPQP